MVFAPKHWKDEVAFNYSGEPGGEAGWWAVGKLRHGNIQSAVQGQALAAAGSWGS